VKYTDFEGYLEEKYDVNTIEFLGNIGVAVPINNSSTELFFKVHGGYGLATAEHIGTIIVYSSPEYNSDVQNDLSKGYFTARLQGGIEIKMQQIGINISLSYRHANAGVLTGDQIENGHNIGEQAVKSIRGDDIEFDYSGILFSVGVSFYL